MMNSAGFICTLSKAFGALSELKKNEKPVRQKANTCLTRANLSAIGRCFASFVRQLRSRGSLLTVRLAARIFGSAAACVCLVCSRQLQLAKRPDLGHHLQLHLISFSRTDFSALSVCGSRECPKATSSKEFEK